MSRIVFIACFVVGTVGCGSAAPDVPARCACTPTAASAKASTAILQLIQRHQAAVLAGDRNGRETQMIDDELRNKSIMACDPCGAWIGDRATAEELYPLAHATDAVGVTCTGLRLRDGTTVYGDAHPAECR